MNQNSISYLEIHTRSAQVQQNIFVLFHTFDLRVELYAWNQNPMAWPKSSHDFFGKKECKFP